MNTYTLNGWTVNNTETDSLLLNYSENLHLSNARITENNWRHTTQWEKSSDKINYYKTEEIYLLICGNPSIYNRETNKYELINKQNQLQSLLEKYKQTGYYFLRELNGSFSICLYDRKNHLTLLAIDRMGIEQMHYACPDRQLLFSSSLKNLSNFPSVKKNIKPQSIYNYFYFHCIPSPDTIFEDIYKLKPAEVLLFKNGSVSKDFFWKPEFNEKSSKPVEEFRSNIRTSMDSTVADLIINEHTGAFLSGGTDSSTISGLLKKHHPGEAPVFSIGFEEQGYDEMEFADITVSKFNNKHYKYYVTFDDVLNLFNEIPKIYEEPFGNSSVVPTYAAAKFAKENGVVHLLGGDGGDELFAGNSRYVTQQLFNIYSKAPKWLREIVLEPCLVNNLTGSIPIVKKAKSYIEQAKVAMPKRMQTYNILHTQDPASIFNHHYFDQIDDDYPVNLLSETYNDIKESSFLNKMLYLDWKFTLADNDIRKVNTMCRAAGVDVSYPFLDNRVVESSTDIPSQMKLKSNRLRAFYKDTYITFLPPEIITKPKHGFGLPFGVWLKKDKRIQEEVYATLTNLKSRSMFQDSFIDDLIDKHRSEHAAYYGTFVWVLAILERWLISND